MRHAEIIRFLFVGAASAGVQLVLLAFLLDVCNFPLDLSVSVSYVISVAVHFFGNKFFTFRSVETISRIEIVRYFSVVFINYIITVCIVWFAVQVLKSTPYIAMLASIASTVGVGFVLNKIWVFKA